MEGIGAAIEAIGAPADTSIGLPRFDLAAMVSVKDYLAGAGVSALFEDETALRGIADDDLVVGDIARSRDVLVSTHPDDGPPPWSLPPHRGS